MNKKDDLPNEVEINSKLDNLVQEFHKERDFWPNVLFYVLAVAVLSGLAIAAFDYLKTL